MWCGTLAGLLLVAAVFTIAVGVACAVLTLSIYKEFTETSIAGNKLGSPVWPIIGLFVALPVFVLGCGVTNELGDRYEIDGCR